MINEKPLLFSIIIPVYNIERYLSKCIESILKQKVTNFEIILVDDGSTDTSGILCDQYAQKYAYIHSFHKQNGGLSDARNYGVKKATGKYLVFVDGDDFITEEALDNYLYVILQDTQVDIIIEEGLFLRKKGKINERRYYEKSKFQGLEGKEVLQEILKSSTIWCAYGKCFAKEFWVKNQFMFTLGLYAEDMDLIYKVIYKAQKVYMVSTSYIYFMDREGSLVNRITEKQIQDLFRIFDGWKQFFDENQTEMEIVDLMNKVFSHVFIHQIMGRSYLIEKQYRESILEQIENNTYYIYYDKKLQNIVISILLKMFGMRKTCFCLSFIKRISLQV